MTTIMRPYEAARDFMRVRNFLSETFRATEKPLNWRIERWNYARYFVAPMIGAYGKEPTTVGDSLDAIRRWEATGRIWEDDGELVAVVCSEHPDLGEAFLLRRPGYDRLLAEMLDHAERTFVHPQKGTLTVFAYADDAPLEALLASRGYEKQAAHPGYDSVFEIRDLPHLNLPAGFTLRSMADENDIEKRREAFGRGFNHEEPLEWPTAFSYRELQKAPDYRPEQDLYVVGPRGDYVAFCIVWYDERNCIGSLEPVGTHPDYRWRGLAKAVVLEAIRRVAALGATEVWVGSGQRFYEAVGFKKVLTAYPWRKTMLDA
ncbi:MAG: GNAT family N-acetyltransferase [Anaerolineae bacterium]